MCSGVKSHSFAGFTLIEMIITLVIVGFIGVVGTYGLVYGVSIYRSIQGIEIMMPQIDVAMNAITQTVRESGNEKEIKETIRVVTGTADHHLRLKGKTLLTKVKSFDVSASEGNKLFKVTLEMEPGATGTASKTFVFYVSSNRGE